MSESVWSEREKEAWQLPKDITVSEWADQNRMLDPMTSSEPGKWCTSRTPYLEEPMNAVLDPEVENIVLMMSTQVGKTECMLNILGYHISQDPAPTMWVMPNDDVAKEICKDRIKPMCELSPDLQGQFTDRAQDTKNKQITFRRMHLYIQGGNSPAGLASKPIRLLIMDELDKYKKFSGSEADPIKLAEERTRTFWNRKKIKTSTPTTEDGYIWNEYGRTDQRRCYVPCPHCGKYQFLVWSQVNWPKEIKDPDLMKAEKLAWYECKHCKERINDLHKQSMLQKHVWAPNGAIVNKDGSYTGGLKNPFNRGYWMNALYSPWLTFSEIVCEFLKCYENGEVQSNLLMNFVNSWLAEPWRETLEESKEDEVKKLSLNYSRGEVPDDVVVLTAGVDVQLDHFWFVIRGWGYGNRSWLIDCGRLETWDEVISKLFKTLYRKESTGEEMQILLSCIDSGYRTNEVYDVTYRHRNLSRPTKGMSTPSGQPFTMSKIDRHGKSGKVLPRGLALYSIDTKFFKDSITGLMNLDDIEKTKFHIFKDPPENYIKQMTSEHKVKEKNKKGKTIFVWKTKSTHAANHMWDCEVYAAAAARMLRVHTLRKPGETATEQKQHGEESKRADRWINRNRRQTKSWIHRE